VGIGYAVISIASLVLVYDGTRHTWLWLALAPLMGMSAVYQFRRAYWQSRDKK
jgi:hypothetical protein